jgi:hypothetical protein
MTLCLNSVARGIASLLERLFHRTKRPMVLTVNGKADAVLMATKTYEKHLRASNMMRLLIRGEEDVAAGRTRSMRSFLKEFKYARKILR